MGTNEAANDEAVKVEYADALAMLAVFTDEDGRKTVHTFIDSPVALLGADWDYEDVRALIESEGAELSGPMATGMGHGLIAHRSGVGPVFFATKGAGA